MKRSTFLTLSGLSLVSPALGAESGAAAASPNNPTTPMKKVYRHAVFFKFKEEATPAAIKEVETAFLGLKEKIPSVQALEWGTNVSPENHAQGFTHCFFLTFADKETLVKTYLDHPDHKAFGAKLGPILDKVFVFDYVAQ
jgi:Stress responsive A/B Barrel Domain